jgi:outer membrane biosynthesis protein TonB
MARKTQPTNLTILITALEGALTALQKLQDDSFLSPSQSANAPSPQPEPKPEPSESSKSDEQSSEKQLKPDSEPKKPDSEPKKPEPTQKPEPTPEPTQPTQPTPTLQISDEQMREHLNAAAQRLGRKPTQQLAISTIGTFVIGEMDNSMREQLIEALTNG